MANPHFTTAYFHTYINSTSMLIYKTKTFTNHQNQTLRKAFRLNKKPINFTCRVVSILLVRMPNLFIMRSYQLSRVIRFTTLLVDELKLLSRSSCLQLFCWLTSNIATAFLLTASAFDIYSRKPGKRVNIATGQVKYYHITMYVCDTFKTKKWSRVNHRNKRSDILHQIQG